jgi:hypothetical protein
MRGVYVLKNEMMSLIISLIIFLFIIFTHEVQ